MNRGDARGRIDPALVDPRIIRGTGIAGQHTSVAMEQRDGAGLLQRDRLVKAFKISGVDRAEHDAKKRTLWPLDAAGKEKRPGAGGPADDRIADEYRRILAFAQM